VTILLRLVLTFCLVCASGASLASDARDAIEFNRSFEQGAVIIGRVFPGTKVVFDEKNLPISPEGYFVLGLDRDEPATAELQVDWVNGGEEVLSFPVKQREYQIQKIEGVPKATVNPNPKQIKRSRQEAQLVWQAREHISDLQDYRSQFQWPLVGRITGVYGSQRFYNGEPRRPHYGIDIARPKGTQVQAPAGGIVRLVHPDMFFSGGTLIIDHGQGLSSTFIHLSKILVEQGQRVMAGDAIAEVGASGRATGPHLDWRMNWYNKRVDPTTLVGPMPE